MRALILVLAAMLLMAFFGFVFYTNSHTIEKIVPCRDNAGNKIIGSNCITEEPASGFGWFLSVMAILSIMLIICVYFAAVYP